MRLVKGIRAFARWPWSARRTADASDDGGETPRRLWTGYTSDPIYGAALRVRERRAR